MGAFLLPVTSAPRQQMTFTAGGLRARLTLFYNPVPDGGQWHLDLEDADSEEVLVSGYALVCGTPILRRMTLPFFFRLIDTSGLDLNPYGGRDMGMRCKLYVVEKV
ncbi:MAG TPA: hypothetical protein VGN40_21350 [Lelliottia sp.]|jgi:hypothetical protein